jgi:two-component system response regulator GlrR
LYYRLNVLRIVLPPLRERREDIPLLANFFLRKFASAYSRPLVGFEPEAMLKLINHSWLGNVRELENTVQRGVVLAREMQSLWADFPSSRTVRPIPESFQQRKARIVAEFEKAHIEELLAANHGNISHAATAAGKNRRAFWQLLRKHKIDARRFKAA